jgi:hypothetical protein
MIRIAFVAICTLTLAACGRPTSHTQNKGRYAGIGIYPAGEMWDQVKRDSAPQGDAAARLDDDEQIIVVVDSLTGEVRQCGNLSGYCVSMKPWSGPMTGPQNAPVAVTKHATDLAVQAEGEAGRTQTPPRPMR